MSLFDGFVPEPEWPEPLVVELRPWEYVAVHYVGAGRFAANWNRANASHYDERRMEDDRTAQTAAAACELAVARALNKYWHGSVWPVSDHAHWNKTVKDVGANIEVRRVRDAGTHTVAIRPSDLNQGIVIVAAHAVPPEMRAVEVWGYIQADDGWELAQETKYNYRRLHRRHLRMIDPSKAV